MTNIESNKNPFIIGHPAKGSDFFGRKDLLCSVKSFLQSDSIHLFLSGQRRVGKTSLLQNIRDNFKNNTTGIVYINLQTGISSRLETLLKRLVSKIAGKLKFDTGKINFEDLEINFEDILIEILKSDTNKTIIVLFDEFDVMYSGASINKFAEVLSNSTDILSRVGGRLKLIYALGGNYSGNKNAKENLFRSKTKYLNISSFELETVRELVKLSESSIPFEQAAIRTIYRLTSGNPYYTQCLAYRAFDYAEILKSKSITEKIVQRQFVPSVKSFGNATAVIWNGLSDMDKLILFISAHVLEEQIFVDAYFFFDKALKLGIDINFRNINPKFNKLKRNKFLCPKGINRFDFETEFMRKWIFLFVKKKEVQCN